MLHYPKAPRTQDTYLAPVVRSESDPWLMPLVDPFPLRTFVI